MRVIEPKHHRPAHKQKKNRPDRQVLLFFMIIFILIMMSVFIWNTKIDAPSKSNLNEQPETIQPEKNRSSRIKSFAPDEFRDLYNNFAYPNTEIINEKTSIFGDEKADRQIRMIAENRGYQLRSAPVSNAFVEVSKAIQLQQRAADDWTKLLAAAKKDSINLSLSEGFRSAEDQKAIFLSRLGNIAVSDIAAGLVDERIDQVLKKTAPPGYSRHHSGYTVDLICESQPYSRFEDTVCFDWLSKDNYLNAKKHGWIPSYPAGTKLQGPEPESWEYVWVGIDALQE